MKPAQPSLLTILLGAPKPTINTFGTALTANIYGVWYMQQELI